MDIVITIIKMIGGLALLIYGMNMLSTSLKKVAREKLEGLLKKATDNIFKGLLTGIIITVTIQSSAATTVMVVGFVNAGVLKLKNSIPIIMGANIGTTITAQILRLASINESSIISLISPSTIAPIILIIGVILIKLKKPRIKSYGQILIGLGILFTGLMTMIDTASGLSDLPIFTKILSTLSNPLLGVLIGALITIIVQSSVASVGIIQAISTTGSITYATTIPVILGQNIGTCFTSILSSIGTSKNAKRTAAVHLYFNLIGTIIFLIIIYTYQHFIGFSFWNNAIDMGGIANFHLIFNLISTMILLPATGLLEKLTVLTIKDNQSNSEDDTSKYIENLNLLDERLINIPSLAFSSCLKVILAMSEIAEKNFSRGMQLIDKFDTKKLEQIQEREDIIDKMDVSLTNFLLKIGETELTENENKNITIFLKIASELEKIGDYSYKISKLIETMYEKDQKFSLIADKELKLIYNMVEDTLIRTIEALKKKNINTIIEIEALQQISKKYREEYKIAHVERLKAGKCTVETGLIFIEIINACERIIAHCISVVVATTSYMNDEKYFTKHEYYNTMSIKDSETLKTKLQEFEDKYEKLAIDNKLYNVK